MFTSSQNVKFRYELCYWGRKYYEELQIKERVRGGGTFFLISRDFDAQVGKRHPLTMKYGLGFRVAFTLRSTYLIPSQGNLRIFVCCLDTTGRAHRLRKPRLGR